MMSHVPKILVAACLGMGLLTSAGRAVAQTSSIRSQIDEHERKLSEAKSGHHTRDEVLELIALGYLYREVGMLQKALATLNEALPIVQHAHNQMAEAVTLSTMGRVYTDMGQETKALTLFNQVLPAWRSLGIREAEANTLNFMGRAYNNLGQRQEALKSLNASLSIWHDLGSGKPAKGESLKERVASRRLDAALPYLKDALGRSGEASTLDNLGKTYADMGQGKEALEYLNQALPIWREAGQRLGEALTLDNMGRAFGEVGQKQNALDAYSRALSIHRGLGSRQGEAFTLNEIGRLYRDLGQHQTALDYYNQALPIWREVGNRNGEGLALNDIGRAYADTNQGANALEYFNRALPIWRETGARRGEATTLGNLSRVYLDLLQPDKALDFGFRALSIYREVADTRGQSLVLGIIGRAYSAAKQPESALSSKLAALSLATAAGDPGIEGGIETSLMLDFRNEHRPEEAILFGLQAVNAYQQIRKNISGLDKDLQAGFVLSRSATYRILAELLLQADRLGEAEQVLDLLKEQELKEVVRGAADSPAARAEGLQLTAAQQKAQGALEVPEKTAMTLMGLSADYAVLRAKAARTADEDARMTTLEAKIEAANREVSDFFRKTLYPQLAQKSDADDANALLGKERSEVSRLQTTLSALGPHVMGIRLLVGDDHAYAIVVTAQARKKFELHATPAELRSKVLQARNELRSPASDPRPRLAELFAMVVAPFADELGAVEHGVQDKDRAPTLLWSLDGVMRYLPMAALYDGHRYLAERFNNVLFTPASYGHMAAPAEAGTPALRILAMGLSKSYGGLPPLPGVLSELDAVAHDPAITGSHGPMDGVLLPDERFTWAAWKARLGAGATFPVVHIASHFVLEAGSGKEPYLMLGGEDVESPQGYQLTLSAIEDSPISFRGTRLLTLSACSTAKSDVAADGLEMDSLGMIAQQKDAEAVLATLWDVNDASTSRIMSDFYARWVRNPAAGKAEALRQAQLAFLRGTDASPAAGSGRGVQPVADSTPAARNVGYAHPYYWAPFVLIGNYQ
jgi:CHAT domain-containing protein/tetratricopeptide (TPR) repeat protein